MGITPRFTRGGVTRFLSRQLRSVETTIFDILQINGEQFVAYCRNLNTYKDRTGNLRASIGYVISKDGKTLLSNIEGGGQLGKAKAGQLIKEVQAQYPIGYTLIVVAGMDYAAYVEAKGFDVITGGSQIAAASVKRAFDRLKKKLGYIR